MKLDPNGLPRIQYAVKLSNYTVLTVVVELAFVIWLLFGPILFVRLPLMAMPSIETDWHLAVFIAVCCAFIVIIVGLNRRIRKIKALIDKHLDESKEYDESVP